MEQMAVMRLIRWLWLVLELCSSGHTYIDKWAPKSYHL